MSGQRYLIVDFETRSECDLKRAGAWEYSVHPSTQIICAAWRVGTKEELLTAPIHTWSPATKDSNRVSLRAWLMDESLRLVAHNALFEQVITQNVLFRGYPWTPWLNPNRWMCTAAQAASLALPRDLEGACAALGLPVQKDMEGRRLILKYCKPRKPTKSNPDKWHSKVSDLKRIIEYCKTDIEAETHLFLKTYELNETERKVWLLDQQINLRGARVDRELVEKTLVLIEQETKVLNAETVKITGGQLFSTTQNVAMLKILDGLVPDLKAKTVADTLANGEGGALDRRLLEIRQSISKTSTAKYEAFEERSRADGRVRDTLLYHGASTGRWSGRGIQPQNFPRGTIRNSAQSSEVVKTEDLETIRLLYGNPMEVFSSNLRGCIIPSEGKELFCGDYSSIEARVLFWLAGHKDGLAAYVEGRDLYKEMAVKIYGKKLADITKPEREVGKRAVLGCGYNMGPKKFGETCETFGNPVSEELAQRAVKAYREMHEAVPLLWNEVETVAIGAVRTAPNKTVYKNTFSNVRWFARNDFLWCELPSKRKLAYYKPEIRSKATPWGEKRPCLYHWNQNSLTRQWECTGTYGGRLVENIVQAVARDFMAEALLRLEAAGYEVLLSVHDELLCERKIGEGSVEEFTKLMEEKAPWGVSCPIKVDAWSGLRYRK